MKKATKKWMSLLLAVGLMASALTGCGGSGQGGSSGDAGSSEAAATETGTQTDASVAEDQEFTDLGIEIVDGKRQLNVGWEYITSSVSPFVTLSGPFGSYYYNCLEALCTYDAQYNLHNVLAKDWSVDETGTVCSVEIYDYITDSEGTNITAEDVCFSIETCQEKGIVSNVKAATPTGDYTLTIELNTYQIASIEDIMASCPVVSKEKYEASGDEMATKLVATGPYVVVENVPGSELTLEANENYWQTDDALKGPFAYANVDRIKYVTLQELSQREIALETGEINYMHTPGASSIELLGGDDSYVYTAQEGPHTYLFLLSMNGIFADVRAREALNYAIDRQGLIKSALSGYGFEMGVGLPSANYDESWTESDNVEYNPDKAKELLEEAGLTGKKITVLATANYSAIYELVQAYLNAVGLEVEVVTEETLAWQTDWKDYEKYDLTMVRMQSSDTAYLYQQLSDTTATVHPGYTVTGIQDDKLTELSNALNAPGGNTTENYKAIHDYIVENYYAYCPLRSCVLDMWRADAGLTQIAYGKAFIPAFGSSTYIWNS